MLAALAGLNSTVRLFAFPLRYFPEMTRHRSVSNYLGSPGGAGHEQAHDEVEDERAGEECANSEEY